MSSVPELRTSTSLSDPSQRWAILLFAVVTPLVIWSLDMSLLSADRDGWSDWTRNGIYFAFVLQIGLLGWFVGRFLKNPALRWFVYLWLLVLINLVVVIAKLSGRMTWPPDMTQFLGFAVVSGEVGMLIVWSVLGFWRWYWRLPFFFSGVLVLYLYLQWLDPPTRRSQSEWISILVWQGLAAMALCLVMRLLGFKLNYMDGEVQRNADDRVKDLVAPTPSNLPPQFSIFHLLVWTTALAPLFAVVRFIEWSDIMSIGSASQPLQLGLCFAVVSLFSIWCGLGRERLVVRLVVTAVATYLLGSGIALGSAEGWFDTVRVNRWIPNYGRGFAVFWVTWITLASSFMGGMLMFFRAAGWRLVRDFDRNSFFARMLFRVLPRRGTQAAPT